MLTEEDNTLWIVVVGTYLLSYKQLKFALDETR